METTNDGFTFRRVSTNKTEHAEVKCKPMEPRRHKADAFEMDEFTFRKVKAGAKPMLSIGVVGARSKKAPGHRDALSSALNSNATSNHNGNNLGQPNIPAAGKKRRTIRMEECLDLSTDSVVAEPLVTPMAERVKSSGIHKRVTDGNINSLIRECIGFLRDGSLYAREISDYCASNYFSDIDYKRDIENAQLRIDAVQGEISKWNRIYEECCNRVEVGPLSGPQAPNRRVFDPSSTLEEFRGKAERLKELEGRLVYFLEGAKTRSEAILKNIFGAVENRSVDALFLLRAMSKLGK